MTTRKSYGREGFRTDRRNEPDQKYWTESVHTVLSYWFGVLAVGIQFSLGFLHLDSFFGQMCVVEGVLGLSGLLFLDLIHGKKSIYPKPFKKVHPNTFTRFVITFGVIALIQFLFQIVPLITREEMALAIVFCSVCEEYFFRGLLMEPCFRVGMKSKDKFIVWKYSPEKKKTRQRNVLHRIRGYNPICYYICSISRELLFTASFAIDGFCRWVVVRFSIFLE